MRNLWRCEQASLMHCLCFEFSLHYIFLIPIHSLSLQVFKTSLPCWRCSYFLQYLYALLLASMVFHWSKHMNGSSRMNTFTELLFLFRQMSRVPIALWEKFLIVWHMRYEKQPFELKLDLQINGEKSRMKSKTNLGNIVFSTNIKWLNGRHS